MKKICFIVSFLFTALIAFCQNPILLKDVFPGVTGSSITQIVKTSNYTFFSADDDDADTDRGLFRTDGTAAGTIKLNLTYPTFASTKADFLTPLNDKVVFVGDNFSGYYEIWSSDGTQAGTVALERFQPTNGYSMQAWSIAAVGNYVYYSVITNDLHVQLRRTDGTAAGTGLVKDFGVTSAADFSLALLKGINNVLYFDFYMPDGTDNLWRSDGTEAGTQLVTSIPPTSGLSSFFMQAGSSFYFFTGASNASVLWKSDGTTAGTAPLKTIGTTFNSNTYPVFTNIGSTLYFAGNDNVNGRELWKTDGTAAGTVMIADINPGSASSNPSGLTVLNNKIYFSALSPAEGFELRKSDGTSVSLVKDINPGTGGSSPSGIVVSNNTLLFAALTTTAGTELWISDGTSQNTLQVYDINPGAANSAPFFMTGGNTVYFSANNNINGAELFTYDNAEGIAGLHKLYVNDNSTTGDVCTSSAGDNNNAGTAAKPFATIAYAISKAVAGDTIVVDAGVYPENITVNKSLTIRGAKTGICPGASLSRGNETIITPPSVNITNAILINITAADVKLDGLTLDGDNPALTSSYNMNGADVDGFNAINNNTAAANNMQVINCIIKNFNRSGITAAVNNISGIVISCNHIDNFARLANVQGIGSDARGITLFGNNIATITNNFITRTSTGILISTVSTATASPQVITNNTISTYTIGLLIQSFTGNASPYEVTGNTITKADYATWNVTGQTNPATNVNEGIRFAGMTFSGSWNFTSNNISGCNLGMWLTGVTTAAGALNISNTTISDCNTGITANQISAPGDIRITGGSISGSTLVGIMYTGSATTNSKLNLDGVSLANNAVGIDASYVSGSALPLQFNNTAISGGTTGLRLYGNVSVPGNILNGINFSGQSSNYILLSHQTFNGQVVDATSVTFDGLTGSSMTLAQRFAAENKIIHQVDYNGGGFIRIKSGEVFVTPQSFIGTFPADWGTATTAPSIQRAVSAATATDIVNIAAGTYTGQVSVDKALTLKGEGLAQSFIARGASGVLTPLPGLSEAAVVQTTSGIGDVIIQDLTVDGSNGTSSLTGPTHAIMLQTGGAVRNCEIKNMQIQTSGSQEGNGILVGYTVAGAKTIDISNNYIHGFTWVGMNIQGNNISATITNNTIDAAGASYGMPIAAGGWGSDLASLNIANNDIKNYNGFGVSTGSIGGLINNNSFAGIGNVSAIINNGAAVNATCNWFGTIEIELIKPKITGNVTYGPWLTIGTDNNVATGFQPVANACNGRQNKFYVNDNSRTGDIFTTAVGNNANNGSPSAPFATLDYAYGIALAGDSIFVDAGTYDLGNSNYTLSKALTWLGTNYEVSPNDAANKLNPNAARNAESIMINGLLGIASSNITFKGFTFNMGDRKAFDLTNTAVTNNDFGNFLFEKNILKINTINNFNQFNIIGKFVTSPALPVTSGYTISDNRFEKSGSTTGTTLNFNYIKDLTISGNSFVVTGGTPATQTAVNLGATGIVDDADITGNVVDASNIFVNTNRVSSAVIASNRIINTGRALNVASTMPESSSIEFSNNIMETTTGGGGFIGYNRSGTSLAGTSNLLKIENNTITGVAVGGLANQLFGAMNFTVNNTILNPSFIIRGNKITYSGNFNTIASDLVRPITVRGNVGNVMIEKNEIVINDGNTMLPRPPNGLPANPGITINTDLTNVAFMTSTAVINILNNKIEGCKQSVVFYDGANGINSYVGYGNFPAGATVNVNNNSFTGDSISINSGDVGQSINTSCNWYGSASSQNVAAKVSGSTIMYNPWLTSGTDADVATGFQPVVNSCNGVGVDVDVTTTVNVTCNGLANGSINITVTGGATPFTFAWLKNNVPGFSTSEDISGLAAGTYRVIVTDANGSVDTVTAVINQPDLLMASGSGTNVSCFGGADGTATVNVTGGTSSYTYLWINGSSSSSISGLAAGNYSVTVTDANGCSNSSSYEVTQPDVLSSVPASTNVSCFGGSNGTASVTTTGGTLPYSYLWNTGATTSTINGLVAGNYSVTVTDAKGCTTVSSYEVTQPTQLTVVMTGTDAICVGTATATPSGGTGAYTYLWNNGLTTQTINVPKGNYTVTVKDANNCTVTGTYSITGDSHLNPTVQITNVNCFGGATGSIVITGSAGTPPFTYNINGSPFQSNNSFSGLTAGFYIIGVKDFNGCTDFVTKNITQPPALTVVADSVRNACYGINNGKIFITAAGGSGARTYSWNGPNGYTSANQDPNNIFAGTYNLTMTDAKGCSVNLIVNVAERPQAVISEVVTNVGCKGSFTGAIDVSITGGSGLGFNYKWTAPGGYLATTEDITGLKAGNYTLVATDKENGCAVTKVITVSQPAVNLSLTAAKTNATGCNSLGTITGTPTGGTTPYQYSLDAINYQSSNVFTGLYAGTDTLWLKDFNGCTVFKVLNITDNGTDQYEGNNTQGKATTIALNASLNARIGPTAADIDWFKFATTSAGSYTVTFTQPVAADTFALYNSSGIRIPQSSGTAVSKTYATLAAGTTYSIKIAGAVSPYCYTLSVSASTASARTAARTMRTPITEYRDVKPEVLLTAALKASVYPNPHNGIFNLVINSPADGFASIDLFNANGQRVKSQRIAVKAGTNTVTFRNIRESLLLYKVTVGSEHVSGKVVGPN